MAETLPCLSCGHAFAKGDRFCPKCGKEASLGRDTADGLDTRGPATNPTVCGSCSAPMGRDDRFCPKCGQERLEEATVVSHVSLRNAQAAHLADSTTGEFEIIQQLGVGAMGSVYLARDVALSRRVAIKLIASNLLQDESMVSRFRLEAQTVASLRHPNIVNVHAVRQAEDLHYFVMDFIDGPPLRSIVKAHAPLEIAIVQALLYQIGSALDYAHHRGGGVIHRDIKPANIMVDLEGDAFVTDFGISKIAASQTGLTQTGATIGTPEYMSPEQCRGDDLTGASDQYALGVVAYEMLTGKTPFSGSQYFIMVAHTSEEPEPITKLRPDCPQHVADAVHRMLAKTADERWPDLESAMAAMGGKPLGRKDPVRKHITALAGSTAEVRAIEVTEPIPPMAQRVSDTAPKADTANTATSVTVMGVPTRVEEGDAFTLSADVRGATQGSIPGLSVVWSSTDPAVAVVTGGRVHALKAGTAVITASVGNLTNSVSVLIAEAAAAEIVVQPSAVKITSGERAGLQARVHDRQGRHLERPVRWLTSDARVVSVSRAGEIVATGSGVAVVTAESGGVTGTVDVVVEAAEAAVAAAPPPAPAPTPESAPAAAVTGAETELTPTAGPTTTPTAPPTESTAAQPGQPTPSAQSPQHARPEPSAPATRPKPATPPEPAARPKPAARPAYRHPAALAALLLLVATGALFGARSAGLLGGTDGGVNGEGDAGPIVGAAAGGQESSPPALGDSPAAGAAEGSTPATGTTPTPTPGAPAPAPSSASLPASLDIQIESPSMTAGDSQRALVDVLDAQDNALSGQAADVRWSSNDRSVVTVNETSGALLAIGPGGANVTARLGDLTETIRITVAAAQRPEPAPQQATAQATTPPTSSPPATPTSMELNVPSSVMDIGSSQTISATLGGPGGGDFSDRLSGIRLTSSDPSIVTVEGRTLRATAVGSAEISASLGSLTRSVPITVQAPVQSVVIDGGARSFATGDRERLEARVLGPGGVVLPGPLSWSSSASAVATVNANGVVSAIGPGQARISAESSGVSGQIDVIVVAAERPARLPNPAEVEAVIEQYIGLLTSGNADRVRALHGNANDEGLNDLLDLMDDRGFAAVLDEASRPVEQNGSVGANFRLRLSVRGSFGGSRSSDHDFRVFFTPAAGRWDVSSVVVRPG